MLNNLKKMNIVSVHDVINELCYDLKSSYFSLNLLPRRIKLSFKNVFPRFCKYWKLRAVFVKCDFSKNMIK